jgi:acyl carrier protein
MNDTEIVQAIVEELIKVAPGTDPAGLDMDENLRDGLDIDSFDALNFFIAISERLGVNISEKDMGRLNTKNEILAYLLTAKKI